MALATEWIAVLHQLDRALAPWWLAVVGVGVLIWLAAAGGWVRFAIGRYSRGPVRWGLFAVGLAGFFAFATVFQAFVALERSVASQEIAPRLDARILAVTVDGRPCRSARQLVDALRSRTDEHPDHSLASRVRRVVRLESVAGPLQLTLARDEMDPRNWWVFYGGFHLTAMNDIGHVVSDALDHC